ncbi:MAG: phosphate uptake regulator PhoU [Candidatus Bathyarchaeota archaeon]|nr:phosphate uptake regulator PhoU [Candidatus Bathyarchaeota archaeon]
MQGRRIQKVGPSTLTVSLPSSWTKEVGLKKGDLVFYIPQSDGSLKLRARELVEREKKVKEFVVNSDLCDREGLLERIIVGNYLLGHDIISIVSSKRISNSHSEEIRRISRKLIGLGIIEETPIRIILQCSIEASKFPIDMVVRRLYAIASTIHKEAIQALCEMKMELAEEAIRREEDADMMYWLASRLLYSAENSRDIVEKIDLNKHNILNLRMLVGFLERMADWGEKIGKNVIIIEKKGIGIGEPIIKGVYQLSERAYTICVNAMESVFTGDIKIANTAIENYKKKIEQEEEKLVQDLPLHLPDSEMASNLRHILWGIRRIAELGAEIAELSLNQALDRSTKLCKGLDNSNILNKCY